MYFQKKIFQLDMMNWGFYIAMNFIHLFIESEC